MMGESRPRGMKVAGSDVGAVGDRVSRLELADAWLVDPIAAREGLASLVIEAGKVTALRWRRTRAEGHSQHLLVMPGLFDLHAHFREPGGERSETIATGLAAAAHGGFTTVCLMPNTDPPVDSSHAIRETKAAAARTGSPVRVEAFGTITRGRGGAALAPLAGLAEAGAAGFSDDGSPVADGALFRHALTYAAGIDRPVLEHAEEPELSHAGEAHEGLAATILGLRGAPASAETTAVARDLEILADVVRALPAGTRPQLHLTHLSCEGSIELVRRAKAAGLPVTCDVTPHHLALHDGWVGGDRRFAWQVNGTPWSGGPAESEPFNPDTRVNPPLRSPTDATAIARGIADGTVDAIATDHAPHAEVDKAVEFGDAAAGISGIETALGLVLSAVESGLLDLATAVRLLTVGPASVLGRAAAHGDARRGGSSFQVGTAADLVVVDPTTSWTVSPNTLLSRGKNTPLSGRELPGRVLLTIASGRVAYADSDIV
jgi:dihydroorotase